MKNVFFVLPYFVDHPIGGYKIVYEYANRLSHRGWEVSIGYDCRRVGMRYRIPKNLKHLLVRWISEYRRKHITRWFPLSSNVKEFCICQDELKVPTMNVVATACTTAKFVLNQKNCNKLYLIQGFENWDGRTEEEVKETYRYGMKNIVIADWLKRIVDETTGTQESFLIRNGLDFQVFGMDVPPEDRREDRVCMLYHRAPHKGSKYGIEALQRIKACRPNLQAVLFGTPERPAKLPSWITYVQNATQEQLRKIYNESAIFLYPSIEEGFGLTCIESMACGCALCASDYRGVHEFATHKDNALLSPIRDTDALAENVLSLLQNSGKRVSLARKGMESVRKFDWNQSVKSFEALLRSDYLQ